MEKLPFDIEKKAEELLSCIRSSDKILVGAGAGLSAAAGLSYMDGEVFKKYFPEMAARGYRFQYELVGMRDDEWTSGRKWAYWATHINYVRNIFPPSPLYKKLLEILSPYDYFVVTSNCDRQFMRTGFPMDRVFEFQGNYDNMGCSAGCTRQTWDNREYLQNILKHINHDTFECSDDALPRCPYCGELGEICFRGSDYRENRDRYVKFVEGAENGSLCLIELGVGFNTPGVIRWPFEKLTYYLDGARLFRVNTGYKQFPDTTGHPEMPQEIQGKSVSIDFDAAKIIEYLYENR